MNAAQYGVGIHQQKKTSAVSQQQCHSTKSTSNSQTFNSLNTSCNLQGLPATSSNLTELGFALIKKGQFKMYCILWTEVERSFLKHTKIRLPWNKELAFLSECAWGPVTTGKQSLHRQKVELLILFYKDIYTCSSLWFFSTGLRCSTSVSTGIMPLKW